MFFFLSRIFIEFLCVLCFYVYAVILAELPEINFLMMMIVMEGSNVNISQQQQQQRRYNCVTKDGSISLLICGMCNFYMRDRLMISLKRNTNKFISSFIIYFYYLFLFFFFYMDHWSDKIND